MNVATLSLNSLNWKDELRISKALKPDNFILKYVVNSKRL